MHRFKVWLASLFASAQMAANAPPAAAAVTPPTVGADPHDPLPQPEGLTRDQVAQCALVWMAVVPQEAVVVGAALLRQYAKGIGDDILAAQDRQKAFARYMQALAAYSERQAEVAAAAAADEEDALP